MVAVFASAEKGGPACSGPPLRLRKGHRDAGQNRVALDPRSCWRYRVSSLREPKCNPANSFEPNGFQYRFKFSAKEYALIQKEKYDLALRRPIQMRR